jgi:DNA-binding Lrp family transcriptional regulator
MKKLRLSRNEKLALKMLIANSRISDSNIAAKLRISSQAVGKIRRKLEKNLIRSYSVDIDYGKLGIQTFAVAVARFTKDGLDHGELETEMLLLKNEHVVSVYRLPKASSTHIIIYGFRDITEFDNFFHSSRMRSELHKYIEIQELFTFSHNSLLKNSPVQLYGKIIDELDIAAPQMRFGEIESYKRRI